MNIGEQVKCNQCLKLFSLNKKPMKMPKCPHNICQGCLEEINSSQINIIQCGFCDLSSAQQFEKQLNQNNQLLSLIESSKKNESLKSTFECKLDTSLVEHPVEEDGDLLIQENCVNSNSSRQRADAIQSTKQISIPRLNSQEQQTGICQIHEKPLQIICVTDLKTICPHCAIFSGHKDHTFKTFKQFSKDVNIGYETMQVIKKRKYITDKSFKGASIKQQILGKLQQRKEEIVRTISLKYEQLVKKIKEEERKVCEDLEKVLKDVGKDIELLLEQENKVEAEFIKWELECENNLNKVEENAEMDEKIRLMYGPLRNIEKGYDLITKLEKRHQIQIKKMESIVASVSVEFLNPIQNESYAAIIKKGEDKKKENLISILQKIDNSFSKHIVAHNEDFGDNSFICDFSKEELSMIGDGQASKSNVKKGKHKADKMNHTSTTHKFISPQKKISESTHLVRCKSNENGLGFKTEKRISQSRILDSVDKDPSSVVAEFLKHDLREVLDLSRCQLTDESVYEPLKMARKQRRIRGLKLCQNSITDGGFEKIIDLLNSTSNLNLSYNQMTEEVLSMIIKNRDKLSPLRIINLSFNKINEKRAKTRIDTLKKMGIIVNI